MQKKTKLIIIIACIIMISIIGANIFSRQRLNEKIDVYGEELYEYY